MHAILSAVKAHESLALFTTIEERIYSRYREKSGINGVDHARRVVNFAGLIAILECPDQIEGVLVGAALHDIGRLPAVDMNEERRLNADHGVRGSTIAARILRSYFPHLDSEAICYAIAKHNLGLVSDDPFVGAIWDADRLDLFRIKDTVSTDRFSTSTATLILPYAKEVSTRARWLR